MRVLHFGSNYLPNKGGNVVRMMNLVENNQTFGLEIFLMTTAKPQNFNDEQYFNEFGVKIIRIDDLNDAKIELKRVVEEYNIDIVVTHTIPANIIACRTLPIRTAITTEIHSLIESSKVKNYAKILLHRFWLNGRTKKFFVLSRGAAEHVHMYYGVKEENIIFLPNGRNDVEFHFQPGNPKYFTFGYVGTFYTFQGTDLIKKHAEDILCIGDNVRLYLVGNGEKQNDFDMLVEKYSGRLIVNGLVPKEQVAEHMKEIDVLMIPRPSRLETETAIPLKIFDSVESGKPVIISDVNGLIEVLKEGEAYIYDKHNTYGLVEACKIAYSNAEKNETVYQKAVERIKSWPTWSEIHTRQNKTLEEVIYKQE